MRPFLLTQAFPFARAFRRALCSRHAVCGLLLVLAGVLGACQQSTPPVESHLQGRVVLDSSSTSQATPTGFQVLVVRPDGRRLDTLGYARTGPKGRFQMRIQAPTRGIYTLALWPPRGRQHLGITEYVVAEGDSATLHVSPTQRDASLRPVSPENRALRAYRSAMTVHRRLLTRRLQAPVPDSTAQAQSVRLTSSTLWTLRRQYPGTYAAQFAAVESLAHLAGWNDSLVVERARRIAPSSPYYVDAARIARRAEARRHGHRAALALVDSFQVRAPSPRTRAGVKAVRVQAFLDSLQVATALDAAERLRSAHPHTRWARWARRVRYEAQHLQPGQMAPPLRLPTLSGDTASLRSLRGRPVVLGYYRPGTDLYALQRPLHNALYDATRPDSVAFLSVSIDPDSLVNRAFLRQRRLPGHKAIAAQGLQDPMATRYNVTHTPTWFLIDKTGALVDRYQASDFPALHQHLEQLLRRGPEASSRTALPPRLLGGAHPE